MTNQEAFDKAYDHMVNTLKARSMNIGGNCIYDGTMCAVGCLMTKEELKVLGSKTVRASNLMKSMEYLFPKSELLGPDTDFLDRLQVVHDSPQSWYDEGFNSHGHQRMEILAHDYDLKYNKPKKVSK